MLFFFLTQGGPGMMPMGPMGMSPRLMSQLGVRFPSRGGGASGGGAHGMRFPGSYF